MSDRTTQIDQRWLAEKMTRLVNSPTPTGTIVDCATNSKIAQAYVEEVNQHLGLGSQAIGNGKAGSRSKR